MTAHPADVRAVMAANRDRLMALAHGIAITIKREKHRPLPTHRSISQGAAP